MKILTSIKNRIKDAMRNFIIAFYGSIILFILITLQVIFEYDQETLFPVMLAVFFAMILSLCLQLMSLKHGYPKKVDTTQRITASASAIPCYFMVRNIFDSDYVFLGYTACILFFITVSLYIMYDNDNKDFVFPQIIKSGFFSSIVAMLFSSGISLCLLAFDFLVTELPDNEKWYIITFMFAYVLLFFNIFISSLPKKDDDIKIPKIFKVLTVYVGLPIYILLLSVLYAYLVKILFTFTMPSGQINIFASLASLFFIFFYLNVGCFDDKYTKLFKKYGGWALLPVIFAQSVSVYIRVNAYGLTVLRWMSIILSVMALAFVIVSLIKKGKFIKYVIGVFAAVILVSGIGPLNIIDVPVYDQSNRMKQVLIRNDMLQDNKIVAKSDISEADKKTITSTYGYLVNEQKSPEYLNTDIPFFILFGFERIQDNQYTSDVKYVYKYHEYENIDISEYKEYSKIASKGTNDPFSIEIDGVTYDISEYVLKIDEKSDAADMTFDITDEITVFLTYISYEMNAKGQTGYAVIEGFILIK